MVEFAGARARDKPRPVHRDAPQRVWRVEGTSTFLEARLPVVALRFELQAFCEPSKERERFAPMYERVWTCGVGECW